MGIPQKIIDTLPLSVQDPINKIRFTILENKTATQKVATLFKTVKSNHNVKNDMSLLMQLHEIFPPTSKKSNSEDYVKAGLASFERLRFIEKYFPLKDKDILEIGAGYGETLFYKDRIFANSMTGVDFPSARKGFDALKSISGLEENESLKFLTGDFLSIDFGSSKFDTIFSFDTFEHFDFPNEVFNQAAALLRPNGFMCFVFGPLFRSPQGAHRYYYTGIPYFQNIFSDALIYEFFKKIGAEKEFANHKGFDETSKIGNPFSEMNRWKLKQFEKLFSSQKDIEVVKYQVVNNYMHISLAKVLQPFMVDCEFDELFATSIFVVLRKKN